MTFRTRVYIETGAGPHFRYSSTKKQQKQIAKRWSLFVQKCQQYADMGLDYSTRFEVCDAMGPCLVVEASGTPKLKRRRVVDVPKPYRDKGRPLNVEQCRKRRIEAQTRVNDPVQTDINAMADLEFYRELERLAAERADGQQRGRRVAVAA